MEEEWVACNRTWENINQMMIDLQFPTFRSPSYFQSIEEVSTGFKRTIDEYQTEIKKIMIVERGHLQKFAVGAIKTVDQLEQLGTQD
jgi:hypothetical protein